MIAPASMLDGQIQPCAMTRLARIPEFANYGLSPPSSPQSYTIPFFKEGTQSSVVFGDKRTHQMDFSNSDEAMREIALDIEEGADIVMVKPALFYLDVVYRAKQEFNMPLAVYDVSGEYSMINAAARLGRLDRDAIMMEALMYMKRAGADIYHHLLRQAPLELLHRSEGVEPCHAKFLGSWR